MVKLDSLPRSLAAKRAQKRVESSVAKSIEQAMEAEIACATSADGVVAAQRAIAGHLALGLSALIDAMDDRVSAASAAIMRDFLRFVAGELKVHEADVREANAFRAGVLRRTVESLEGCADELQDVCDAAVTLLTVARDAVEEPRRG